VSVSPDPEAAIGPKPATQAPPCWTNGDRKVQPLKERDVQSDAESVLNYDVDGDRAKPLAATSPATTPSAQRA
jgi:hypothetical protein